MRLKSVNEEGQLSLTDKLGELTAFVDNLCGAEHELVLLVHQKHGPGECQGVAVMSQAEQLTQIAGIIEKGLIVTIMTIRDQSPPPGETIQ
jgi:hypothetical protein